MESKNRIKELRLILNKHNINYYVNDNPTISDSEYDQLLRELQNLEKKHPDLLTLDSPTQRIGGTVLPEFKTITHRLPMQSLSNAMNISELESFNKQIKKLLNIDSKIEYIAEPKLDGLAVELVYENGLFVYGSTRGDGSVGEDITHNLKTIKSIPLSLNDSNPPKILEIRGEVFINKDDFDLLNKKRSKNNQPLFANPRNCAAGSLRQLDSNITMERPLRIFCYAPGVIDGIYFSSQREFLNQLPKWGFPVNPFIESGYGIDFLTDYYQRAELLRTKINYDIDGVVFKVNSYQYQSDLGIRSKSPRWAIAGKLKAEQATTIIENIIISVGRTGALTPVAQLKPINIGGVMVSNATLHNQDEINRKDIRIGDTVLVQRAGDVIPEVIKVITEKRISNSESFFIPDECPICHDITKKSEDEVVTRCINMKCYAKIKGLIEHFVSKNCLNIDGLGVKIVELLINKSKQTTLSRFLFGLGIRHVGQNSAKILERYSKGNIDTLINTNKNKLLDLHDIGDVMADSIIDYFSNLDNIHIINKCLAGGIQFKAVDSAIESSITNKTFVFTGNLGSLSRKNAITMIEKYGAKSSSSVSSKTDYIVAGEKAGSKLNKAINLNVKVLTLVDFKNLMESLRI